MANISYPCPICGKMTHEENPGVFKCPKGCGDYEGSFTMPEINRAMPKSEREPKTKGKKSSIVDYDNGLESWEL